MNRWKLLIAVFALCAVPAAAQFVDGFGSAMIDPAWTVVQTWPGGTPRAHGYTQPGNGYTLAANPGSLRYTLDPMTHPDGFLNGYATTYSYHSCCNHDAGLELHRTFAGDSWRSRREACSSCRIRTGVRSRCGCTSAAAERRRIG